jgi:predicted SprT family Zn-dependent metalloprotease
MYIGTEFRENHFVRVSKKGKTHTYSRKKTVVLFRCDCCQDVFTRDKGNMDPKRLNNNFYHVCGNCDAKKFAQEKGVEARSVWDMPVSSLKTLGQL